MLKNPYTRIAIASALATLITPKLINSLVTPEISPSDGLRNEAMAAGVTGATVAFLYTILSMAMGPATAA